MSDRQLIADLLSALEYHTEQTRPIEFSRVAIEAAREYLKASAQPAQAVPTKFKLGDKVRKTKGSQWHGTVVGTYSTDLTPEGYAVESATERGSVQIYPAAALESWVGA